MMIRERQIAIMGYRSVGKSSLSLQFVDGQFVDSYDPTIENTFSRMCDVDGQEYDLKIIDTAGQDEYSIFPTQYAINYHGYILVYSITSEKSFEVIKNIYDKLLDSTGLVNIPLMLVGNKKDLEDERAITFEEGKQLANSWKVPFMETTAKEHDTVTDLFFSLLKHIDRPDPREQQKSNCVIV